MPKATFFNLSDEKRKKIKKAIKNEFSRTSFSKASISNIVEEAQIPRGSFYQYFEDKEDALRYIIEEFIGIEKEKIRNLLIENDGDIFKVSIGIFDYMTSEEYSETDRRLFKNIVKELKNENNNIFEDFKKDGRAKGKNSNLINTNVLNLKSDEDLKYMMRILTIIVRAEVLDILNQKKDKSVAKKELEKQIEILKRGMEK